MVDVPARQPSVALARPSVYCLVHVQLNGILIILQQSRLFGGVNVECAIPKEAFKF